jgi:hypothetical protein
MTRRTAKPMATEFDPDAPVVPALDKEPVEMTADERAEAAKHTLYEVIRAVTSQRVAAEYLAELAGVSEEEVTLIGLRAETDEYRDLAGPDPEPKQPTYEVRESYDESEAAGDDPEAAADRIWEGSEADAGEASSG